MTKRFYARIYGTEFHDTKSFDDFCKEFGVGTKKKITKIFFSVSYQNYQVNSRTGEKVYYRGADDHGRGVCHCLLQGDVLYSKGSTYTVYVGGGGPHQGFWKVAQRLTS